MDEGPIQCYKRSVAIKTYLIEQPQDDQSKPRLDNFLAERLPQVAGQPVSKSLIRKLIIAGAVYLNRSRVKIASKPVFAGSKVEIHIDWDKLQKPNAFNEDAFELKPEDVLYADEDIIVVNKPSGLPTQPTLDRARNNLYDAVKKFLNNEYAGLHHRLDRDTSGLVLFTKSQRANAPVAELFQKHNIQKTYVAVVGFPFRLKEDEFVIENHLKKDPNSASKMARYTATTSGGDYAKTEFKVISNKDDHAVILAKPVTGRTHQIRVHLSEYGTPIFGDILYGKQFAKLTKRMMLHALWLEFKHPITGVDIKIEAPVPKDMSEYVKNPVKA